MTFDLAFGLILAAIGAAVGAAGGYIIGRNKDKKDGRVIFILFIFIFFSDF